VFSSSLSCLRSKCSSSASFSLCSSFFILSDSLITSWPLHLRKVLKNILNRANGARIGEIQISPNVTVFVKRSKFCGFSDPDPYLALLPSFPSSCFNFSLNSPGMAYLIVAFCPDCTSCFCLPCIGGQLLM
jgi:hypothetical protein